MLRSTRFYRVIALVTILATLLGGCGDATPTATPVAAPATQPPPAATNTTSVSAATDATAAPTTTATTAPRATTVATPANLSGSLDFLVFGEPAEAKAFVDVAKGFEQENPAVKINTIAVPSQPDHLMKLTTAFAAGDPPDVWVIDYRRYGLLQNAGVIEPVEPYL